MVGKHWDVGVGWATLVKDIAGRFPQRENSGGESERDGNALDCFCSGFGVVVIAGGQNKRLIQELKQISA